MKYSALVAYDVSYYATVEFEAESDEAAIVEAKRIAHDCDSESYEVGDHLSEHRVCDVTRYPDGKIIAEDIDV